MRVGIVGAGIAGLGAARKLQESGHQVVVFEKSRGPGGRATTRRIDGYAFDSGATSAAPYGRVLETLMTQELDTAELVRIEKPIYTHNGTRVAPPEGTRGTGPRFCYQSGINMLGKLMAKGLDVRTETKVEKLEEIPDGGFVLMGEVFDAAILTCPVPQAEALLKTVRETRSFQNCRYRMCLSVMLGFTAPLHTPFIALIDPDQQQPLNWLSIESVKIPGGHRAPSGGTALVAQLGARYSQYAYEHEEEKIVGDTVVDVARLLGKEFSVPAVSQVMRWRYSQPETTASFETINKRGSRLLIAGDGLSAGRLPDAYESGLKAAEWLMETP